MHCTAQCYLLKTADVSIYLFKIADPFYWTVYSIAICTDQCYLLKIADAVWSMLFIGDS